MQVPELIFSILRQTVWQLCFWCLPLLVLGVMIHQLAGAFQRLACRIFGVRGYLLIFGWLGTAVHELSHAVVAVLFGHKIDEIKLFRLSPQGKNVGYVRHRHDPGSIYQRAGRFFVAAAPLLIGAMGIWTAAAVLAPGIFAEIAGADFGNSMAMGGSARIEVVVSTFVAVAKGFFRVENFRQWQFYLFLYLLFAIGSAMRLSPADLKGAGTGALLLLALLVMVNGVEILVFAQAIVTPAIDGFFAFVYHMMTAVLVLHFIVFLPVYAMGRMR
ncbi:MAG: hypothetical protein ACQERN_04870 [Thermodesulfobacteriota bacterium]